MGNALIRQRGVVQDEGLLARLCKECSNVQIFLKDAIPRQPIFARAHEKPKRGEDEG